MRRVKMFMEAYENLCMDAKDTAVWREEIVGKTGVAEKLYKEYTNLNNPIIFTQFVNIYLNDQNIVLHEDDATTVSDLMTWNIREKIWWEYANENV